MKNEAIGPFQEKVSELLIRHRSILDSLTKFQESTARVNRSVAKAVTNCGCLGIRAERQTCPPEVSLQECQKYMDSHLLGQLCEHCREAVEEELGNHIFYLAALAHLLDTELEDIFAKEYKKITALGYFHLS